MCAGGRGGYKFMWMSEGVYARGGRVYYITLVCVKRRMHKCG